MTRQSLKGENIMNTGGVAVCLATISVVVPAFLFERVKYGPMDFIERYLGFSPDSGDGSMEILLAVVLVAIVVIGATRLAKAPWPSRRQD